MKKFLPSIFFIVIIVFAFFLRFYKLGEIPNGLYRDETAIGYNAYSILQTGKDEYGKAFPLYFKSFGDYKLPVYIYSSVIPIGLFGLTPFAVRFPSAFFGFFTIIVSYFFVKDITGNKKLALLNMTLLAINPWMLFYNRATYEVSICLFFFVLGTWCLYNALEKEKKGMFAIGTVCFIISLYGYNLTRLLAPLLYAGILFLYRKKFTVASREKKVTFVIGILLIAPFILTFFSQGGALSASGTLIFTSSVIKANLLEFRGYLSLFPQIAIKIFFNIPVLLLWQYMLNIVSYISIPFFFIMGDPHGNHGLGDMGYFYLFELPFIIYGSILCIKTNKKWCMLLVVWSLSVIFVASLTRYDTLPFIPSATRSFFLAFPFEIFSAVGIISFWEYISKQRVLLKKGLLGIFAIAVLFNLFYYFSDYYYRFPVAYAKQWQEEDKNLSNFLQVQPFVDHIIVDPTINLPYTSILFYQKYPPLQFQKESIRTPDDPEGFVNLLAIGKYEFRQIDWEHDYHAQKTLLVTTLEKVPLGVPVLANFSYPTRPVVISVKQQILSYPVTDNAYVVVASH